MAFRKDVAKTEIIDMFLCRQCSPVATLFCCSGWISCSAYALGTVLPFLRARALG